MDQDKWVIKPTIAGQPLTPGAIYALKKKEQLSVGGVYRTKFVGKLSEIHAYLQIKQVDMNEVNSENI